MIYFIEIRYNLVLLSHTIFKFNGLLLTVEHLKVSFEFIKFVFSYANIYFQSKEYGIRVSALQNRGILETAFSRAFILKNL